MLQKLVINASKSCRFMYVERIAPQKSLQNNKFLTKRWDPLHLSQDKNILDLVYMHPGGIRSDTHLFYFEKSANLKHPNVQILFCHVLTVDVYNVKACQYQLLTWVELQDTPVFGKQRKILKLCRRKCTKVGSMQCACYD